MKKYWFIFCKTDIMLEKAEDSFSIPYQKIAPSHYTHGHMF